MSTAMVENSRDTEGDISGDAAGLDEELQYQQSLPAAQALVVNRPGKAKVVGGRTSNSFLLMCVGCLLFPCCLVLVGWNERRTLCETRLLHDADQNSIVAECDDAEAAEGKFVFFSCPVNMNLTTSFSPQSFNMVALKEVFRFKGIAAAQRIEMYQCIETAEMKETDKDGASFLATAGATDGPNLSWSFADLLSSSLAADNLRARATKGINEKGDEKVYRYKMGWSDRWYDSKLFKGTPQQMQVRGCPDLVYNGSVNNNPLPPDRGDGQRVPLGHETEHASSVVAGVFTLTDTNAMQQIQANTPIDFTEYKSLFQLDTTTDNIVAGISPKTVAVHDDSTEYLSTCATNRLGCVRISYNKSDVSHISVMAKIGSSGITHPMPMTSSWGCGAVDFIRMQPGEMTKDEFLSAMKSSNDALTWSLRVVGVLLCWFTMWCCFEPIASAADAVGEYLAYVPLLGKALTSSLDGVQAMILCLVSCSLGLSCGLFVIAIIWISLLPVVGGPLLGGCVVLVLIGVLAPGLTKKDPNRMRKKGQGTLATDGTQNYGATGNW
mmetsp:Transcript_147311/g.274443  ORF Transcript_147311/g.274443 Transcript_147311/m.274443 type:complete len:551 (-) Transcript_147311:95-1747(-)